MAYLALGDFTFEFPSSQLTEINENLALSFEEMQCVDSHMAIFAKGRFEETLELELDLILEHQNSLKNFISKVKEKKPFFMVLGYGEVIGNVIVESLSVKKQAILPNGISLRRNLKLNLRRLYR